jgi:Thiamine pyrophosphate enzyme, C-terminal TPP binding domain
VEAPLFLFSNLLSRSTPDLRPAYGSLGLMYGSMALASRQPLRAQHAPQRRPALHRGQQIYGLTTGQTSPTIGVGMKTKSMPFGNIEAPVNAISLALAAGATFVARGVSAVQKHLTELIKQGIRHKGFSFLNVFSPCVRTTPTNGSARA